MTAIEIKNLRKVYKNGIEALKGIDLHVESGDFFSLLGVNGAGKSTTIGLITGLLIKTSGSISICGYDLDKAKEEAKSCLGVVPQEFNLNVFEPCLQILLNQGGYYGVSRREALPYAEFLLHELGLWEKRHTSVRELSGGMKRRLMIARALIHKPRVLILDEPTAGVDIEIRRSMWEFLRKTNAQGTTIILTTHYLEEAEQLCNKVAIIDQGKIKKNTGMLELLKTWKHQTYIFTTEEPLTVAPTLEPWLTKRIDANNFELQLDEKGTLNDVFSLLNQQGLIIQSLRHKTNRLEELFMDLVTHD